MQDLLGHLTEPQKQAVTHVNGPVLVLAGPGSGKTRVIVNRVAYMIRHSKIAPWNILAITFTNKAAKEMKNRLEAMNIPRGATVSTFHSLAVRLLKEFHREAGLPKEFSIYDDSDQKAALREIMKAMEIDPKNFPPAQVLNRISSYKNDMKMPDEVQLKNDFDIRTKTFKAIYQAYQEFLHKNAAVDFDDLLIKLAFMMRDNPQTLLSLNERYKYVLVDEYQDTNTCQYQIARGLSLHHGNLFVSGDPDQSIYAWRGADINNILAFEQDFPDASVIRLEENFRSIPEVLTLADEVIKHNKQRKAKKLFTSKPAGEIPKLYEYYNEYEEADGLADWIKDLASKGMAYRDIAVFYRINSMSRVLEQSMRQAGIPYQIVRGVEFFKRKEIKDILSYLQIITNPHDQVAMKRVINCPARGIGNTTIEKITEFAQERASDFWSVIQNVNQLDNLNAGTKGKIAIFVDLVKRLQQAAGTMKVADLIQYTYAQSGLEGAHASEDDKDAADNIKELVSSAVQFESETELEGYSLGDFLQQVALVGDADGYNTEAGVVSLMSLHAAKGLEFPAVRIIGLEEAILPHSRCLDDPSGIEEERRLLFVGITRAEQILTLSMSHNRTLNGQTQAAIQSRFIRNMESIERAGGMSDNARNMWDEEVGYSNTTSGSRTTSRGGWQKKNTPTSSTTGGWKKIDPAASAYSNKPAPKIDASENDGISYEYEDNAFHEGQMVRHSSFGVGKIEKLISSGSPKVIVNFQKAGRKTLVLEFARLQAL